MKHNIEIWYYGNKNAPNGAATFIRTIENEFKNDSDINIQVFDNSSIILESDHNSRTEKLILKIKRKAHQFIGWLSSKSAYVALYYQYLTSIRNIKTVLENNNAESNEATLFFQDIISCYYYYKKYPLSKKKCVIVLHSNGEPLKMLFDSHPSLLRSKYCVSFYNRIIEVALSKADHVVLLTEGSKEIFISKHPEYKQKAKVVLNGMPDLEVYTKSQKSETNLLKFISVGSVSHRKGFDMLIEAVSEIDEEIKSNLRFTIVGEGEILNKLKQLCKMRGLNIFNFLGAQRNIPPLLDQNDVFILVSRDEGLPIAGIEALRNGKPMILSDVGGMAELVEDHFNGFLCQPNVFSIKEAIIKLYHNRENIEDYCINSRDLYLKKFSAKEMIKSYKQILLK